MSDYKDFSGELTVEELADRMVSSISKKIKNMEKVNIVVMGKSGVGKSTLVNSVFKDDFCEVGTGRPVTDSIRKTEKKDCPLVIYDTPGFELEEEQQQSLKAEIKKLIKDGNESGDFNKVIHCIWYCINSMGNRIEDNEIEWIKELTEELNIPVIVVLTQSLNKQSAETMKNEIEAENMNIRKVVPVLAQAMEFDAENIAKSYGLDKLVEVTANFLEGEVLESFQHMQKVSLKSKKIAAQKIVGLAATSAAAVGATPIPFSDAFVLVIMQEEMIRKITLIYSQDISKGLWRSIIGTILGAGSATVLGKTAVSGFLKLIPGVGTAAGLAISSTTALTLTAAVGETYIKIMEKLYKGEVDEEYLMTDKGKKQMKKLLEDELKKKPWEKKVDPQDKDDKNENKKGKKGDD